MPPQERLFLLDGMALAYRAYFAFINRPLVNSKGMNTSAIYGFTTALMRILEDEKPDHIAVVFDTKGPTFRHEMYGEYKATREKMPEDMANQMSLLKDVVRAFHVPVIEQPGYEADDVIGTLARRAEKENVITYMVTGDKDFMQLVSPLIKILRPGKGGDDPEVIDEKGVLHKFGVAPGRVTDVLGLIGDSSDNVPGVPGIGEKTAIPLIQQHGTIENLYENIENVPQRGVREKLTKNRDLAFLSKKLVTIHTDVPVPINFHELRSNSPDVSTLVKIFGDLEFRSLANKFAGLVTSEIDKSLKAEGTKAESRNVVDINSDEHMYQSVVSAKEFDQLVKRLKSAPRFAIDLRTTDRHPLQSVIVGFGLSLQEREAFYIPVQQSGEDTEAAFDGDLFSLPSKAAKEVSTASLTLKNVLSKLKPVLEDASIGKIGYNIKHTMLALHAHGVEVKGVEFDPMVANYILRAESRHELDAMAMEHLSYRINSFEELIGKGKNQRQIIDIPVESLTDCSAQSADLALRLTNIQKTKLAGLEQLTLAGELEFPLVSVLARMEAAGISLDVVYLASMSKELERQIDILIREIYNDAGGQFNINSTQQLGDILFNRLKLPTLRKTKTGFSTDVSVLEALKGQHPIIERMLEFRQYTKLKSTYVDALPLLVNPDTRRLHTSLNQTVALTGRLSSADPNLQNIPIRTELGRAIRKAFVPSNKNAVIMSADYSQIELRVMAHVSDDAGLQEAFKNKEDIHTSTSSKVFGVKLEEVTRDMRRKAKEVNFGIMYGIGPFGLATRLEISQTEAKEIINRYFERFPKVKQYINDTIDSARRKGYVSSLLGRRRYLPDLNSRNFTVRSNAERQAINMPIQGTAADMIKLAMIQIDEALKGTGSRMLLQVHDELVFEVVKDEVEETRRIIIEKMQNALALKVPIEVDVGTGENWLAAH